MENKNRQLLDEETEAKVKDMIVAYIDKIAKYEFKTGSN